MFTFPADTPPDRRDRFEAIAMPEARALYGTALRLTGQPDDAADMVQETLLRALRTFDNFTPGTNVRAWLFTILYSVFNSAYRKQQRTPDAVSLEELEQRYERPMDVADAAALRQIEDNPALMWKGSEVETALRRLPEPFRSAVILVDLEELDYEQASAVLDVPIGTVRSRLFRGRKALAEDLAVYARQRGLLSNPRSAP